MASPTDVLRLEHVVILRALDVLEAGAARSAAGTEMSEGWWDGIVAWLRGFADRNHHAKEERALFPALVKAGVPDEGGPIGTMLEEHTQGRALIQAIASTAGAERAASARDYVGLLRLHIAKENDVLFVLADTVLDASAQHALTREFDALVDELGVTASLADAEVVLDQLQRAL